MLFFTAAAACGSNEELSYLSESSAARREILERALWRPDLPYSRKLLDSYALDSEGWDLLPILEHGGPIADPQSDEEWLALGRDTFFNFPMRSDDYIEWIAARPELYASVGLGPEPIGLVRFRDTSNRERTAIACAFCHAENGEAGRADRRVDLGLARALYEEDDGAPFRHWGPGRVDVTEDDADNPTAIPDLWGVKYSRYLNASGVLAQNPGSPDTLAVRFDTQYIQGHNFEGRADRRRTYALALFVLSLGDSKPVPASAPIFDQYCARCHDPQRGYSGELIPASSMTSDPAVANSPERGTGFYKVPSLLGASRGAPYFHDGSARSLRDVLTEGHPIGVSPPSSEVGALLEFLERL